ncbi:MAG: guanylate kinase [Desulfatitalea sp.]|nr:guanylate kinase [Desulfatitalea sp.]MBI5896948.1 guanylate kinase [Desulfobacterales bacterium]
MSPVDPTLEPAKAGGGRLFVVSAPSGAGKTTLCLAVRRHFGDLAYSVSYTTRAPRPGEQHGKDYFFITREEFEAGIARNRWAEWARVHGNLYGTSTQWIDETLAAGKDILLDIDVQGARQMLARFPQAITLFIRPPSMAALEERLTGRGTDDAATRALRLANAEEELAQQDLYRHVVVNDDLERATRELIDLLTHYRSMSDSSHPRISP